MRRWLCALVALMIPAGAAWADPVKLSEVPVEAKWVLHLDVERLMDSQLGDLVRHVIKQKELQPKIDMLAALTSVDLTRDVRSVTLYGANAKRDEAVLAARGVFDQERLTTIAKGIDGYASQSYQGFQIHAWPDGERGGKPTYAAFAKPGVLLLGPNLGALKVALDATAGRGARQAQPELGTTEGFVFVAVAESLPELELHPQAALLKKVEDLHLSVDEQGGRIEAALSVRADTPETAAQMQQTVLGLQALALLAQQERPELAKLAQTLTARSEGDVVEAGWSCPVSMLREFLQKKLDEEAAAAKQNRQDQQTTETGQGAF